MEPDVEFPPEYIDWLITDGPGGGYQLVMGHIFEEGDWWVGDSDGPPLFYWNGDVEEMNPNATDAVWVPTYEQLPGALSQGSQPPASDAEQEAAFEGYMTVEEIRASRVAASPSEELVARARSVTTAWANFEERIGEHHKITLHADTRADSAGFLWTDCSCGWTGVSYRVDPACPEFAQHSAAHQAQMHFKNAVALSLFSENQSLRAALRTTKEGQHE